ncbi:MAG: glycerol-3-phosphate dehydrogenase [Pseudomonadota bacterium]
MITSKYDLIVIGGGINGAGIARDASQRGLSVLLLEKNDFGSGTSSWSSRLIHGGLRYLEYGEISLVYESLHDRRALLKVAPHLVKPLRISIPIFKDSERGRLLVRLGMIAYDLLSLGKELPGHKMLNKKDALVEMPGINEQGLKGLAQYYDAQVEYAERLVMENVLAAQEDGATTLNYCEVIDIDVEDACAQGVRWQNTRTGLIERATAPMIVNAAGPWVDRVLERANQSGMLRYMGGTKGSHIVLPVFDGAPESALYVEAASDGRPIFIIPWNRQLLVGTTDIRIDQSPEDVVATDEECEYLLAEVNRVFPTANLDLNAIHHRYAGVRPLPRKTEGPESAISRKHLLKHHNHIARGLYSVIGGKLTTYLSLANDMLKRLDRDFSLGLPKTATDELALPGARPYESTSAPEWLGELTLSHLLSVYGGRCEQVVALAEQDSGLREIVDEYSGAIAAEVVFAVRAEAAYTLDDVINRRTMLGLGPDRGLSAAAKVATVMANELEWTGEFKAAQVSAFEKTALTRFSASRID